MSYKTNPVGNRFDISLGWYGKFSRNPFMYTTTVQNYIQFHASLQAFLLTKKIYMVAMQYCQTSAVQTHAYNAVIHQNYYTHAVKLLQSLSSHRIQKIKKRHILRRVKAKACVRMVAKNRIRWTTTYILVKKHNYNFIIKTMFFNSSASTKKFFYHKIIHIKKIIKKHALKNHTVQKHIKRAIVHTYNHVWEWEN